MIDSMAASSTKRKGVSVSRIFTTEGVSPYDEITWSRQDVTQLNWKTGEVVFEQKDVEFPDFWSINAVTIVTTKYFRGAVGTPQRETSLKDVIERVVGVYAKAGRENAYFASDADVEVFADELRWMLLHQVFSFNSPVWFNVGTNSPQQVSACFILSVDDTMDSILNWYTEEGKIFKGGSGAGVNLSKIRSSVELLSSGGTASGPVSFMRGADASAGTIKSGGATRRAAKMVVLDVDHPDIEEFIETKVREERKIQALRDAGFDMDLGGADMISVQYQNANNSVRVSDDFMSTVESGGNFGLVARSDGRTVKEVNATELLGSMAEAAWNCADPGIQYDGTINRWHTCPQSGRISASNPCSEYVHLDNSSCNLASLNLMKFLLDDGSFDVETFRKAVEIVITAMDISICFADFPTDAIGETSRSFRQLGIGYANLGALLMSSGMAYDSAEGRSVAAAITSLMSATAYRRSAELASVVGAYQGYALNRDDHIRVMEMHLEASQELLGGVTGGAGLQSDLYGPSDLAASIAYPAHAEWQDNLETGFVSGWRNSQVSVLAPTGTIGLAMDVDTTGIEPDLALVKFKKLVGGASMQIVNYSLQRALSRLGYSADQQAAVMAFVLENGDVVDCDVLSDEHKRVFQCAMGSDPIASMGHVRMMAAVQPFLSGAISKTVNLPAEATVDEIYDLYLQGWKLGLKALAVYRDGSKYGQPLSEAKSAGSDDASEGAESVSVPQRRRLPRTRNGKTVSFTLAGLEGYVTTGEYDDGSLGELFIKVSKQGSTLSGIMDGLAMAVSVGLQYGVPFETFVAKYLNSSFEPAGLTDDEDIRMAKSLLDYIFRKLAIWYLPEDVRAAYGVYSTSERRMQLDAGESKAEVAKAEVSETAAMPEKRGFSIEAPMCFTCGTNSHMRPSGSCWSCEGCGNTSGCS